MRYEFDFETATKLISHYSYLIGEKISESFPEWNIEYIVIAPFEESQFKIFASEFNQRPNNETALIKSGYDPNKVRVLLVNHDRFRGTIYNRDIDVYLTKQNIEKIY